MNNFISKEKDYIKEYNKNYYAKTKYEKGLRPRSVEFQKTSTRLRDRVFFRFGRNIAHTV